MQLKYLISYFALLTGMGVLNPLSSAGIRDHTRPSFTGTEVNQTQADDLTLTLVTTAQQNLQTWLRIAAKLDSTKQYLNATLCSPNSALIKINQRVRSFPPDAKSSIYQARIHKLKSNKQNCRKIKARLATPARKRSSYFVMEILVQRGRYLAIPKEAIIQEGEQQIVYVKDENKKFTPRTIKTGLKGELYTQVLSGLNIGEQVATFGSFFIDAEYKLKSNTNSNNSDMPHAHHHH
ncbi:hypothetical protein MNBD_GAMMA23-1802 [hydrothermal vent metagenome]|uniref:CzcB-like C-terminal circularly permuted SH3-like domain-containing protein n=1 Tax=hydrothermal vent metagenome TaxID=652676 RepID=A0A3B1AWP1_9ZZZZ